MKLDSDVKNIGKEATIAISKATELFIAYLVRNLLGKIVQYFLPDSNYLLMTLVPGTSLRKHCYPTRRTNCKRSGYSAHDTQPRYTGMVFIHRHSILFFMPARQSLHEISKSI